MLGMLNRDFAVVNTIFIIKAELHFVKAMGKIENWEYETFNSAYHFIKFVLFSLAVISCNGDKCSQTFGFNESFERNSKKQNYSAVKILEP